VKLIGMLDSPYVRRVAISFQLLGLKFSHDPLSVFRTFDEFSRINPVVKAPSLVCDDGAVLMDSTIILEYAEALARPRTLLPTGLEALERELCLTGLALAATEKSVQIVYEHSVRPPEKIHEPWLKRAEEQTLAAYGELERELATRPLPAPDKAITQAGVTIAVGWYFTQRMIPKEVPAGRFPQLAAYSTAAEALPEFRAAPYGSSTYHDAG